MEYKILSAGTLVNEKQLNDLAVQRWNLITIVQHNGLFYFYFSRIVMFD